MDAVVTVSHVNKSFNHKRILHDVNLTASTHEILGLIGPSGAGKTTIIKNIMGMEEPDDGDVTVFWPTDAEPKSVAADWLYGSRRRLVQ